MNYLIEFVHSLNISETKIIITFFGLVFSGIGIFHAKIKERSDKSFLIFSLRKEFIENEKIRSIFYQIEYETLEINLNEPHEQKVDQYLCYLDNIAQLLLSNKVTNKDIAPYAYYFLRTLSNAEINKYLDWVDVEWSTETLGYTSSPFSNLCKLKAKMDRYFPKGQSKKSNKLKAA